MVPKISDRRTEGRTDAVLVTIVETQHSVSLRKKTTTVSPGVLRGSSDDIREWSGEGTTGRAGHNGDRWRKWHSWSLTLQNEDQNVEAHYSTVKFRTKYLMLYTRRMFVTHATSERHK